MTNRHDLFFLLKIQENICMFIHISESFLLNRINISLDLLTNMLS